MLAAEHAFSKSREILEQLLELINECAEGRERIDRVERRLFSELLNLGYELLKAFVALSGDGDQGETLERGGQTLRRVQKCSRKYRSIFGVLDIERCLYATRQGQKGYAPLDEQLSLPADEVSYVLEDWLQRFCVQNAFGPSVESLRDLLEIKVSKRTAERTNQKLAEYVEPLRKSQEEHLPEEEEEVLVVTVDGKGVPMGQTLEERMGLPEPAWRRSRRKQQESKSENKAKKRLGPGHGKVHKQMAFVGAVYTIARWQRTPEEITDEVLRKESQPDRPQPRNKRLHAEMNRYREDELLRGQPRTFDAMAWQAYRRDPDNQKPLVCLMDGQRSLWDFQRQRLPRAVGIVDLFHVMERLWHAAYCFHPQGSRDAEKMVEHYLQMLLTGKVSSVIGSLRRKAAKLKPGKRKKLETTLTYLTNNSQHMKYDKYLEAGYPIGSGVVEGACRHLVRDRMERTGMRWQIEGAQAMLNTRTAFINGEWDALVEHRIQREQECLYGESTLAC